MPASCSPLGSIVVGQAATEGRSANGNDDWATAEPIEPRTMQALVNATAIARPGRTRFDTRSRNVVVSKRRKTRRRTECRRIFQKGNFAEEGGAKRSATQGLQSTRD